MSRKELTRWEVCMMVMRKDLTTTKAQELMGVSYRQAKRIVKRAREEGPQGIIHKLRGRKPMKALREEVKQKVLSLARTKYVGFNDTQLTEKLNEVEKLCISRESVRKILRGAGISAKVKKRRPKHRKRRPRMVMSGMMVQMDGSRHHWLEARGPPLCLMGSIDDATSQIAASHFAEAETTRDYLKLIKSMVEKRGIPLAVYVDMHSALKITRYEKKLEEHDIPAQLEGKFYETQVARSLRELGVKIIFARSPQAKGRVERLFGVLQDRLVSELRLAGASTLEQANKTLQKYIPQHNRNFAIPPRESKSAWRNKADFPNWRDALCEKYTRTVKNDNTISFEGRLFQIEKSKSHSTLARKKVEVRVRLDDTIEIYIGNERLKAVEIGKQGGRLKACVRRGQMPLGAAARPKAESTPLDRAINAAPPALPCKINDPL